MREWIKNPEKEYLNKISSDENRMNFVYRGNVNCKNQTDKEAIDEYYKSIDKTPTPGDIITVNSNASTIYIYLNIPEEKCLNSFVYRGNVKHYKNNQTVKEAIDEYYKGNNATPTVGDVVTVNSVTTYVYLDDWEKM